MQKLLDKFFPLFNGVIFDNGIANVPIIKIGNDGTYNVDANGIKIYTSSGTNIGFSTDEQIDVTGYSNICFTLSATSSNCAMGYWTSKDIGSLSTRADSTSEKTYKVTLPSSGYAYFQVNVWSGCTATIKKVWLE